MLPITADGWATAPRSWSPGAAQVLQGWIPWGLARRRTSRRGAPRAACGAGWGGEQGVFLAHTIQGPLRGGRGRGPERMDGRLGGIPTREAAE